MKKLVPLFLAALAIYPVLSHAQLVTPSANEEMVDRILEINGTNEQMKGISEYLVASFTQAISQGGGTPNAQLTQLVKDSFKGEALLSTMRQYLLEKFDANHAGLVLEWYKTPFGKKIVELETLATKPEAIAGKEAFEKKLLQSSPSKEDFALYQNLDKALHSTEDSIDGQLSVQESMYKAFMPADADPAKLKQVMDLKRQQLQSQEPAQTIMDLMYRYDGFTHHEIQEYINFLNTPAGQWINVTLSQGAKNAMKQITGGFANKFADTIKGMSEEERKKIFGAEPSDNLQEYKMDEGAFSVVLPENAKIQEYVIQMKDNYGQMHLKVVQGKTKDAFLNFSYGQYPSSFVKDNSAKSIFEQSLKALLEATKAESIVVKDEQWQGYPAFYFEAKGPLDVFIKGRFVLVGEMIYQLSSYIDKPNIEKSASKIQTFLESLKINDKKSVENHE